MIEKDYLSTVDLIEITKFIMDNSTYTDKETIFNCVQGHHAYNTFSIIKDEKGIVAYSRWNYITKDNAHILDFIIRKDCRRKGIMRKTFLQGLKKFPNSKYITFEKGYDDGLQNKKLKRYKISDFLKRRFLGC